MARLQELRPVDGCLILDEPLPHVLGRVSDALRAAGFGLLTVIEVATRAPAVNLGCEISCLAVPPTAAAASALGSAHVLPCTIRLQARGEQTMVITTMRYAVAEHRPGEGETSDAEAACACVQHAVARWIEDRSIT